jgi:hypothetical protein
VYALRNDFSFSRVTNYEKKLRLESGEAFHNLQVIDHNQDPPDSLRRKTLESLLTMPSPTFQSMEQITGVVQVYHGCFNEQGALTIVRHIAHKWTHTSSSRSSSNHGCVKAWLMM